MSFHASTVACRGTASHGPFTMNSMACAHFASTSRMMTDCAAAPSRHVVLALGLADRPCAWPPMPRRGTATRAAAVRLIAGAPRGRHGGRCAPASRSGSSRGWKTYWRYPGDSGVPPRFDFAGSQNVKAVDGAVAGAAAASGGRRRHSIGYKRDVILPLRVVPQDAAKPVTLRLKLDYAICEKLCVPAAGQGRAGARGRPERAGCARSPRPRRGCPKRAGARARRRRARDPRGPARDGGDRPRVVVDVAAPPGASVDLFAEGPTREWALPLPEPVAGAPAGLQRFAFELDGAAARRQARGRDAHASPRSPATRRSRSRSVSTNSPRRANLAPGQPALEFARCGQLSPDHPERNPREDQSHDHQGRRSPAQRQVHA